MRLTSVSWEQPRDLNASRGDILRYMFPLDLLPFSLKNLQLVNAEQDSKIASIMQITLRS